MKSLILLACCSWFFLLNDGVPSEVQERFEQMFPKVEEVHWEVRKEGHIATFKHYSSLKKVVYHEDGRWIETRIQRAIWSCPDPVIAYVDLNHPEAVVTSAAKVIREEGITYRIEAEYPEKIVILSLNEGGYPLREESIPFTLELDF